VAGQTPLAGPLTVHQRHDRGLAPVSYATTPRCVRNGCQTPILASRGRSGG
jgi:hypothetical protein